MAPLHASIPLVLGSFWALIPAAIARSTLVVPIVLEERALREELEGYVDGTARVRFRPFPGIR